MTSGKPPKSSDDDEEVTAIIPEAEDVPIFTQVDLVETPKEKFDVGCQKEFTGDDIKIDSPETLQLQSELQRNQQARSGHEKRSAPRYDLRIQVFIMTKKKTFKTHSNNISLSGILLQDPLPRECISEIFEVVIVNGISKSDRIVFRGKIVGDIFDPRRITFLDQKESVKTALQSLLNQYIRQKSKV